MTQANPNPPIFRRSDPLPGPLRLWSSRLLVSMILMLAFSNLLAQAALLGLVRSPYSAVGGAGLFTLLIAGFTLRAAGSSLSEILAVGESTAVKSALAALAAAAAVIPTSLLASLSFHLRPPSDAWLEARLEQLPNHTWETIAAALAVGVIVPVAEELVFRGMLHRLLRRRLSFVPAAILSSLAFGLAHGEPWFLFGLMPLGLLLAWIYETTGSLLSTAVGHGVYNLLSFTILMSTRDNASSLSEASPSWVWIIVPLAVMTWALHRLKSTRTTV